MHLSTLSSAPQSIIAMEAHVYLQSERNLASGVRKVGSVSISQQQTLGYELARRF